MKTLNLQVVHRILLRGLLDGESKKGHTLSAINQIMKIIDKVAITEEENKDYNLRTELNYPQDPTKGGMLKWEQFKKGDKKIEIDVFKPFELSDEQVGMIKEIIESKNKAKEFTANDLKIMDIAEQLEIKLE